MFSDDDFDDVVIRAAVNVDEARPTPDLHEMEQLDTSTNHEVEADLELALKLSAEFSSPMTDYHPQPSRVNLNNSSASDVVAFNEDDDFELAVRLSKELNSQDSPVSHGNSKNSSASNIITCDEDGDFELALKLSKKEINLQKNDFPSTSRGSYSSSSNVVTFDEDKDFELALKLSMESVSPATNLSSSTPSASSIVPFDDDRDFELALKRSLELSGPSTMASSSRSASSVVPFDYDRDFELALKLSSEFTSDSSPKSKPSTTRKESTPSGAKPVHAIPVYDIDEDIIVDNVVRDIIASQETKSAGRSSVKSPSHSRMPGEDNQGVIKYLNKDISVVDPSWETIDPNPDIHAMFVAFNKRFFWGKLGMVEVKWSPRMTLCAGNCTYRRMAGHCIVNLSKPLLQLRPRKDLVETLLHEMIHAYLFVTHNDRDRDGHGPRFHSHMYRINRESGANISVYHNFHDEVKYYKQHEWRCNGPCRDRPPFYGFVRRSMNRAPGPNDNWWADHAARCTGQFVKTNEPKGYANKKAAAESRKALGVENKGSNYDIENYFKNKSFKSPALGSFKKPASSPSSAAPPPKFPPAPRTTAINVAASTSTTGPRIFTINDLSNGQSAPRSQSSPKKWIPLQGQGNIRHFVNNS